MTPAPRTDRVLHACAEAGAVVMLLAGALALRTWNLARIGWGNDYYAAAVRSMAADWHAFFFAAFDPAGFISVDKPPLALWLDVASVRLFGFSPLSVLLPHAVTGVAAVGVLYAIVRPTHGPRVAWLAGLLLAISPVNVATDRSNLTDSLLVLVLLGAAWSLLAAVTTQRRTLLWLAFALVGVAFNVKMLAAYVVLPVFAATWLLQGKGAVMRRCVDVAAAGAFTLVVSSPWVIAVELTPPAERPYVGSSTRNSIVDLAVGYNGVGRFGARARAGGAAAAATSSTASELRGLDERTRNRIARLFVRAPAGPLRLADGQFAAQVLWLLPLALAGVVAAAGGARRGPLPRARRAVLFWCAWLVVYAVVYSFAAGTFHYYYLGALAPAVAALAAAAIAEGWRARGEPGWRGALLPLALLVTAGWQVYVQRDALPADGAPGWMFSLAWWCAAFAVVAACAALFLARLQRASDTTRTARGAAVAFAIAFASLLGVPLAWTLSSVVVPANGVIPSADLLRLEGEAPINARRERMALQLAAFLQANRAGERFIVATSTYQLAAPLIIATGEPVMARGGFHGQDPALTADQFAARVANGEVRFAALGDMSFVSRRFGAGQPDVVAWIRAHGTPVDPALWRADGPRTIELYDLRGTPPLRTPAAVAPPAR